MDQSANLILERLALAYCPATAESALAYLHAMEIVCEVARMDKDTAIDNAIKSAQEKRKAIKV